jgi:hypothetical protein
MAEGDEGEWRHLTLEDFRVFYENEVRERERERERVHVRVRVRVRVRVAVCACARIFVCPRGCALAASFGWHCDCAGSE